MKKLICTLLLCYCGLTAYTQNEAQPNTLEELKSPIMLDFLKNYQEKNKIIKMEAGIPFTSELSKRGIKGDEPAKPNDENIDNLVIVKPNLVEILRMPTIRPDETVHHTMRIVNSDTSKPQPIK